MSNELVRQEWASRFGRLDPKIICVGLNYRSHAGELEAEVPKAPLLFGKFANTLCWNGDAVVLPASIGHVDAEAELAVVIGERASGVPERRAMDVIAAYTCANDLSARDAQFGDGQWFRGKGFDGFCPIGPRLVDASDLDPSNLHIVQRLNGEVIQEAWTRDLLFTIAVLVSYISTAITLEAGDLILTGTPAGVGFFREPRLPLRDGDAIEIEVEGIGVLRNEIVFPASAQSST
jgi:2,4-diketo-3-deoxy-L-fuconate hydrolase